MPSNMDRLDAKLLDNIEQLRDDGSNWKVWKAQTIIALEHREVLDFIRSEEHTSELQSHLNLVCRLLLEKKKDVVYIYTPPRNSLKTTWRLRFCKFSAQPPSQP